MKLSTLRKVFIALWILAALANPMRVLFFWGTFFLVKRMWNRRSKLRQHTWPTPTVVKRRY